MGFRPEFSNMSHRLDDHIWLEAVSIGFMSDFGITKYPSRHSFEDFCTTITWD